MGIGEACAIFKNIKSDKYTVSDKYQAISIVLMMETHNGITKAEMLDVLSWILEDNAEWEEREVISVKESGIEEIQIAKCPYCQRYHTTPYMYYFEEYPFCPNCGRRIKESKNEQSDQP